MDELLRAVILGATQGLSEFLPISSSGHLILVSALFGWEDQGLAFDVGLHTGTLLVLLGYFWRDWYGMAASILQRPVSRSVDRADLPPVRWWLIVAGSVPVALTGLLLDDWIATNLRSPMVVASMLLVVGVLMLFADRRQRGHRSISDLNLADVALIGFAQAVALIPGVSRSGATMAVGLERGLSRVEAARFAFLLGTPAFAGAALLELPQLVANGGDWRFALIGATVAAVVGLISVHGLMRLLRTRSLLPFAFYRFGLAAVVFGVIAAVAVL